jgi:hypothetical protein
MVVLSLGLLVAVWALANDAEVPRAIPSSAPPMLWGCALGERYTLNPADRLENYYADGLRYLRVMPPRGTVSLAGKGWPLLVNLQVTVQTPAPKRKGR